MKISLSILIASNVALFSSNSDAFVVQQSPNSWKGTQLSMRKENVDTLKNMFVAAAISVAVLGNPSAALADGMCT
jgi:hypothetical protein